MPGQRNARLIGAILLLVTANLIWAGQGVAVKLLSTEGHGLGAFSIALLPLYAITLLWFAVLAKDGLAGKFRAAWKLRREFFFSGICGQLMAQVGMTIGVRLSTASNGAILSLLIPIFGALIAAWVLHERLSGLRIGAMALGCVGVMMLSPWHHPFSAHASTHELTGNILIVFGCFGSAFYNVYSKRLLEYFSAIEILFFSYLATAIFSLPLLFAFEPDCLERLGHLSAVQWVAFAYLAVLFYGLAMMLFLRALHTVDVIVASASLYLVPLFGVSLAFSILGERLSPLSIAGSAIVLLGTLMLFLFDFPFIVNI